MPHRATHTGDNMTGNQVRVQLFLSAKDSQLLDKMVDQLGAPSRAEVIRSAIKVYAWLLRKRRHGFLVALIVNGRSEVIDLPIPGLEAD